MKESIKEPITKVALSKRMHINREGKLRIQMTEIEMAFSILNTFQIITLTFLLCISALTLYPLFKIILYWLNIESIPFVLKLWLYITCIIKMNILMLYLTFRMTEQPGNQRRYIK